MGQYSCKKLFVFLSKDRERETKRERETDRQTDRQTDRKGERERDYVYHSARREQIKGERE